MVSGPIGVSGFEEGEFKGYSPTEEVTVNQRPKRDPSSDRLQLLGTLKKLLFRLGSRSAPIGTPTSGVLAIDFSDLLLFWPGSRFGADSHAARRLARG